MAPPLATSATQAQALAYLNSQWGGYTYRNNASTPYQGKGAAQLYSLVASENPGASPYSVAVTVSDLLLSSGFAGGVQQGTNEGLTAIGDSAVAAANPQNYPSVPNPLRFLGNIANFFGDFTQASTWIRVAKVVIGGTLLIVGVAHLTGANNVVDTAAKVAPVLAA